MDTLDPIAAASAPAAVGKGVLDSDEYIDHNTPRRLTHSQKKQQSVYKTSGRDKTRVHIGKLVSHIER